MASENKVRKNLLRLLRTSKTGRLEARSVDHLKRRVGAADMSTSCFQQLLADMKHGSKIRGFSFKGERPYIQA